MPEVSVIIPVYKVEPFLRRCVDSVLEQTFVDFELILVDDGSPDNCGLICDKYVEKDGRIRVIHKQNGGVSSARNAGLNVAKGRYIYFCDGDDFVEKDLLKCVVDAMDGYDMVVFNYDKVDESGCRIAPPRVHQLDSDCLREPIEKSRIMAIDFFVWRIGKAMWHRLLRKDIIDRFQLRFPEGREIAEDQYFILCYLYHANSVRTIPGVYYHYVKNPGSIVSAYQYKYDLDNNIEICKAVFQHFRKYPESSFLMEYSPFIFYGIMCDMLSRVKRDNPSLPVPGLRTILLKEIQDTAFFLEQVNVLVRSKHLMIREKGVVRAMTILTEWTYYLNGNLFQFRIMTLCTFLLRVIRKVLKFPMRLIPLVKIEREDRKAIKE